MSSATSTRRVLYPQPLLNQVIVLTIVSPITIVAWLSKTADSGSMRTSDDTIGSELYSRMPAYLPVAALRTAAFTSSVVVGFDTNVTRSTVEPSATGTFSA